MGAAVSRARPQHLRSSSSSGSAAAAAAVCGVAAAAPLPEGAGLEGGVVTTGAGVVVCCGGGVVAAGAAVPTCCDGAAVGAAAVGAAVAAGFGGGICTRSAGVSLPRRSVIVGKMTVILFFQPSTASPKAPRIVRLLVLFSTRPRLSLVNHTTSFFSCFSPTSSSVAAVMRNFFSRWRSAAFRNRDWSYSEAKSTMGASLLWVNLQQIGCQPNKQNSSSF